MAARDAFPPFPAAPAEALFLNLWWRRGGGWQADLFLARDEAAADAASPSLYHYGGTVVLGDGAAPHLVDLSALGAAVLAERAADAAEERAFRAGLTQGAGRIVL